MLEEYEKMLFTRKIVVGLFVQMVVLVLLGGSLLGVIFTVAITYYIIHSSELPPVEN